MPPKDVTNKITSVKSIVDAVNLLEESLAKELSENGRAMEFARRELGRRVAQNYGPIAVSEELPDREDMDHSQKCRAYLEPMLNQIAVFWTAQMTSEQWLHRDCLPEVRYTPWPETPKEKDEFPDFSGEYFIQVFTNLVFAEKVLNGEVSVRHSNSGDFTEITNHQRTTE